MNRIKGLISRFRAMWRSVGHERNSQMSPIRGIGPNVSLTEEQFRQLMIAALEDSPRARLIVRQAFLPSFPIRGGQGANTDLGNLQSPTNINEITEP